MAELEAHFENDRSFTWRHMLPAGPFVLGRLPGEGNEMWATPWDNFISRKHATLHWQSGRLVVQKLPSAGNPVFLRACRRMNSTSSPPSSSASAIRYSPSSTKGPRS